MYGCATECVLGIVLAGGVMFGIALTLFGVVICERMGREEDRNDGPGPGAAVA